LTATTNTEIKNRIQRRHQAPAPPWSSSTGSRGRHAPDSVVAFSGMRSVLVYCSNPACHHKAEIDASGFPDEVTFGDLQPRMLCTVCNHRGGDVSPSWHCG